MERYLALEFVNTLCHDGHGGVRDELADPPALTAWVRDRADLFAGTDAGSFTGDESIRSEVVALRRAVRSLFARAVSPAAPSQADAHRLMPIEAALAEVNRAASRQPVTPALDWPADAAPVRHLRPASAAPVVQVTAELARASIDFLSGSPRESLLACTAPRCVRYFVKAHGRQGWCKPSCANRARAARHYQRHRATR